MKNKRFLLIFLAAVVGQSCVTLFGPKPANLVGTWVLESIEGELGAPDQQMIGNLILEFREDGTMKTDLPGTMEYIEGTYEIDQQSLLMTQDNNSATARIISLKNGQLWIEPIVDEDETPYQLGFVRKM